MMKYKIIDLCAGIGGIRRGFELTGRCENVLSCEVDKFACKTYEHLYGENPLNDISSKKFKSLISNVDYDILLAGFPCQSFSSVGKREGFKDVLRGTIFFHIAEIIEKTRPKAFLLENVEGLISHDKGKTFKTIVETLLFQLNYHIIGIQKNLVGDGFYFERKNIVLNAKNFGLPQNRPRVYLVGFDEKRYENSLKNLKFKVLPQKRRKKAIFNDLKDVLEKNVDNKYYLSQGYLESLKKHKSKQKSKGNAFGYEIVNTDEKSIANALLASGGSGKERNLIYDPRNGISGINVKNKKTPLNSEGIRIMTPNEWAKLQGFLGYGFKSENDEAFSFPDDISDTQKYKQLGNSVAIPVVREIAGRIVESLDYLELADNPAR